MVFCHPIYVEVWGCRAILYKNIGFHCSLSGPGCLMFIFQELLRELGRELEQTVGEVEGVQQMLARMELEKMGLQVGDSRMIWVFW